MSANTIIPHSLRPGSKIALITPATVTDTTPVLKAMDMLRERGYRPTLMPHALTREWGTHPATPEIRVAEIMAAFADPTVDAILCTRGGYGCNQLLPLLNDSLIKANPKWLIGYSDISALHAYMNSLGIASIHGPMTGHMAKYGQQDSALSYEFDILERGLPMTYTEDGNKYNIPGTAKGTLIGGNMMVLNGLAQTPWDMLSLGLQGQDVILAIEDVSEKIYAIERVLMRLHQCGALRAVKGIIVGRFSDYGPDATFNTMEEMISYWLERWGYTIPVAFDFPMGHLDQNNYPLVISADATLSVSPQSVTLTME